ncbi:phage protease [Magnetospirillum fulvum]|uniref:Mu-like prophage I protein n=1 Tax=Magnetospirillum fulvum TaxID=1082 RepID=A0A1H6HI34_MAGFU|nr:phage protease [Magnetospirillum fulvum]SEH35467.1 Mu-like prophage I protein [Magnetospirillum fulvum]
MTETPNFPRGDLSPAEGISLSSATGVAGNFLNANLNVLAGNGGHPNTRSMASELTATCSVALADGAVGSVHLMPFGRNTGRDGRGPFVLRDKVHAAQVIKTTVAYQRGADLPIDYEHQTQRAPRHVQPRPAAGWIKADGLHVGPNGIWGRVEWTTTASQHLNRREYRYLSPVFQHAMDGSVLRIVGAALTNLPNLELTALASQGATMDTLTSAKTLLGLDGADDATFLKTCDDLAKLTQAFVKHLGLPSGTGAAGVMDALMKRTTADTTATASQSPDLSASVAAIQAVASQAETYRQQLSQAQIDTAVAAAMQAGKISPAMREWATALASQSPESFQAFTSSMPPVFSHLFASDFSGRPPSPLKDGDANDGLAPGQIAVCSQMGLSPDDYRKTLKG